MSTIIIALFILLQIYIDIFKKSIEDNYYLSIIILALLNINIIISLMKAIFGLKMKINNNERLNKFRVAMDFILILISIIILVYYIKTNKVASDYFESSSDYLESSSGYL
jgi:hypothetical protein